MALTFNDLQLLLLFLLQSHTARPLQVDLVKTGKPFVMFGDGRLAACKPISEADLAAFMADCVSQRDKVNKTLPIGGATPLICGLLSPHLRCRSTCMSPTAACTADQMLVCPRLAAGHVQSSSSLHTLDCIVCALAGPGKAWTALEQGEFLFDLAGRKPSFIKVPVGLMDAIINVLDFVGRVVPQWEVRHD